MTEEWIKKAAVLMEALPYMRNSRGKPWSSSTAARPDGAGSKGFAQDITLLKYLGLHPVVVHGGGPQIGQTLKQMGIESRFIEGMRVTDGGP